MKELMLFIKKSTLDNVDYHADFVLILIKYILYIYEKYAFEAVFF
jgi:hypothetical protein